MHRLSLCFVFLSLVSGLFGQSGLNCTASANPPIVRAEGIAERTGDAVFTCAGGQPNTTITGNLVLFLNVNVTNKVAADGTADVVLTVNGVPANVAARVTAPNAVTFNGFSIPLTAQGTANILIQNLRGNASQLLNQRGFEITLTPSFTGGSLLTFASTPFVVGYPQRGLLTGSSGKLLCSQNGSPLPSTLSFSSLLAAHSVYTSTRVTEGFGSAFASRSDLSNLNQDSGVRIIANYSGFPANARIFVPDAVAGSDADQPTAGGDLGFTASGGAYSPGKGELLLIRVNGADANGVGGTLAIAPPALATTFNSVNEIPLTNGAGYVVYEVADANPSLLESAQFPTFLGLPGGGSSAVTNESVNLAPLPRFITITPEQDCKTLGDCNASYFPQLVVDSTSLQFTAGSVATLYIPVRNSGSGVLQWTASVNYPGAANFLTLSPSQGANNGTIRADANANGLAPGTYAATVVVDAGPLAGARSIPVTLVAGARGGIVQPPAILSVGNAADGTQSGIVAGSLATIMGTKLNGHAVLVTFNGAPAQVLYSSDTQINLLVPAALAGQTVAQLIVSVDGFPSTAANVTVAQSAPAIFPGAVLNQDWTANGPAAPASPGTILQIFATGLPAAGTITAKVHDRTIGAPYYAGPAPGLPGVQQVDVGIPADLPAMQTWVYVCGLGVCSPGVKVWIGQ